MEGIKQFLGISPEEKKNAGMVEMEGQDLPEVVQAGGRRHRKHRKSHRKHRRTSRKHRRTSRKHRRTSRKHRRTSRK